METFDGVENALELVRHPFCIFPRTSFVRVSVNYQNGLRDVWICFSR